MPRFAASGMTKHKEDPDQRGAARQHDPGPRRQRRGVPPDHKLRRRRSGGRPGAPAAARSVPPKADTECAPRGTAMQFLPATGVVDEVICRQPCLLHLIAASVGRVSANKVVATNNPMNVPSRAIISRPPEIFVFQYSSTVRNNSVSLNTRATYSNRSP
jgi:hypothetical protein